jgi:hypothetical protein
MPDDYPKHLSEWEDKDTAKTLDVVERDFGTYMADQRYEDEAFAERAAMCQDCAEGNEHQCELPADLHYDGKMTEEEKTECRLDQEDANESLSHGNSGAGKSEKILVAAQSNQSNVMSALAALGGGFAPLLGGGIKWPKAQKPMRSGGPVLTGKRLEKLRKSCQKQIK